MSSEAHHRFVDGGCERARAAAVDKIRIVVEVEFAERLRAAGWWERWQLRYAMRREVEKRLDRVAPPWGLYISAEP